MLQEVIHSAVGGGGVTPLPSCNKTSYCRPVTWTCKKIATRAGGAREGLTWFYVVFCLTYGLVADVKISQAISRIRPSSEHSNLLTTSP